MEVARRSAGDETQPAKHLAAPKAEDHFHKMALPLIQAVPIVDIKTPDQGIQK